MKGYEFRRSDMDSIVISEMKTLAVTGGIGSGKSAVCAFFARRGVPVYDSDSRTKALYDEDPSLVAAIESGLGVSLGDSSGQLDRRRLASIVFSDRDKLSCLESIVHPRVLADFVRWRSSRQEAMKNGEFVWRQEAGDVPFVIIESAIILEKQIFRDTVDKVLLVDAPSETRLRRTVARDNVSEASVGQRMSSQGIFSGLCSLRLPEGVDFMIENDSDLASLEAKVDSICGQLW